MVTTAALYELFQQFPSAQTDTRKLKEGDIFFALKGPNFNGNLFAKKALEEGAAYAVVDEDVDPSDARLLRVEDVLSSLQALAKFHREQFDIPFLAITGSNGKTTSKELIYAVLSSHYTTYTTQGNLNNHIGVPLTLLSIKKDAQMAVIEMGANHQKEIAGYCIYTEPTHGLITNCGKAHLEGFGGVEGVRKGKGELYDYLAIHNGTVFAYAHYDYLKPMSAAVKNIIWYGQTEGDVQGTIVSSDPFLIVNIQKGFSEPLKIRSQLVGDYNLPNILAAAQIGKYFSVPEEKIVHAIESYTPSNSRSQMLEKDGNHIILDAYNANPSSMRVAIENFARMQADQKVLMLGGMMELGGDSVMEHQAIIDLISQYQWHKVVLVGGDFSKTHHPYLFLDNSSNAREWFLQQHFAGCYLLIKGSRSMQMEKILG